MSTHGQNDLCECTRCIVGKVVLQGIGMCKSEYITNVHVMVRDAQISMLHSRESKKLPR